ncbi:MAG: TetR family transcriptional regulator [Acidobacteria bacterium]|nr:TetR family transcriptional regulator [Acidobacteriota bacterium]
MNIVQYDTPMAASDRRARHKQQVRREILVAAGELFAQEGYESVSVRRIAEKIEYSPAAIYLYFKDKADLLNQLCEDTFAQLIEHIEACTADAPDPLEGLIRGVRAYIDFGLSHPDQYIVTFVSPPQHQHGAPDIPFEGSVGQQCFRCLESAIGDCRDAGVAPGIDVKTTACTWWASIHGLTSLLIVHERFPWADRNQMIDSLMQTLVAGLLAAPRSAADGSQTVEESERQTSRG